VTGSARHGPVAWLLRHAESGWNEAALVQGQAPTAPGLTAAGAAEALRLADQFAGSGAGAVLSSDLRRAVETAGPIAERLGVGLRTDPRLRERNLGAFEGGPSGAMRPAAIGWVDGAVDPDARAPGGESLREVYARASEWLEEVREDPPAPVFVAVTHGGFLRVASACIRGAGFGAMSPLAIENGAVWRADLGLRELDTAPSRPFR
jgi:broad specificity phosphatase PhoE